MIVRVGGAILAELLGVCDELAGIDGGRIVLVRVIAVEPGEDHTDIFLARRHEILARPGRQIDLVGKRAETVSASSAARTRPQNFS